MRNISWEIVVWGLSQSVNLGAPGRSTDTLIPFFYRAVRSTPHQKRMP